MSREPASMWSGTSTTYDRLRWQRTRCGRTPTVRVGPRCWTLPSTRWSRSRSRRPSGGTPRGTSLPRSGAPPGGCVACDCLVRAGRLVLDRASPARGHTTLVGVGGRRRGNGRCGAERLDRTWGCAARGGPPSGDHRRARPSGRVRRPGARPFRTGPRAGEPAAGVARDHRPPAFRPPAHRPRRRARRGADPDRRGGTERPAVAAGLPRPRRVACASTPAEPWARLPAGRVARHDRGSPAGARGGGSDRGGPAIARGAAHGAVRRRLAGGLVGARAGRRTGPVARVRGPGDPPSPTVDRLLRVGPHVGGPAGTRRGTRRGLRWRFRGDHPAGGRRPVSATREGPLAPPARATPAVATAPLGGRRGATRERDPGRESDRSAARRRRTSSTDRAGGRPYRAGPAVPSYRPRTLPGLGADTGRAAHRRPAGSRLPCARRPGADRARLPRRAHPA